MDMKPFLSRIADGKILNEKQAEDAFDIIMSGQASMAQTAAFLMGLRVRGEAVEEIIGAARTMRSKAHKITAPDGAIDNVGTGGDKLGTLNISTATSLVVAGCGVCVAKHGNKAASSLSGTADVLEVLGLNSQADFAAVERSFREACIGFMNAPLYHSAMRHVVSVRKELAIATLFNILGPLANPANVQHYLMGCFRADFIGPMAETLARLGAKRAWVVHGHSGMDEISTTGPTRVAALEGGEIRNFSITPADAGLKEASLKELLGGSPQENADAIHRLLDGNEGAYRDIVLLNAAAALMIVDKAQNFREGVEIAAVSVDEGHAAHALEKMVNISREPSS